MKKITKFIQFSVCAAVAVYAIGCNSDSSSGGSSTVSNAMTNSFGTVTSKVDAMNFSAGASSASVGQKTAFGAEWETNTNFNDTTCSSSCSSITAKDYMGHEINPDSVRDNGSAVSVFARIENALQIFCAMGVGLGASNLDANSYPTDGSHTITFTAAVKAQVLTQCKFDLSDLADGTTVPLTVTTPSNTTNFDKSISIDITNVSSSGGTQLFMVKATSAAINVATTEDNSNGINRTIVFYDVASDTIRAEYISGPDGTDLNNENASFYRLFYDATNDNGYLMSIQENDTDAGGGTTMAGTRYILAGKPNTTGGTFSLSMDSANFGLATPVEACVNKDTGSITSDGSRCSASSTGLAGYPINTNALLNGFMAGWNGTNYKTLSDTSTVNFTTATDFETAAVSAN